MTESNSSIEATDSHLGRNLSVEPTSPINSNSSSVDTLKFPDQCHLTFHSCLEPTSNPPITLPPTPCIASAPVHPMPTTGFAVPLAEYALRAGISSIGMTTCVTSSCQLSASPSQVCKTCVGYKKNRLQTTSDILLSPINYDHTMFLQEQRRYHSLGGRSRSTTPRYLTSRDFGTGISYSVRRFRSSCPLTINPHNSFAS